MADSDSEEYHSAEEDVTKYEDTLCTNGSDPKEQMPETVPPVTEASSLHDVREAQRLSESLRETHLVENSERANVQANKRHTECDNRSAEMAAGGEFVSNLDNRYVSEAVDVKDEKIELTEEQIKEMKEQANKLKASGNQAFKNEELDKAIEFYSDAIKVYPSGCTEEVAICYANRAACNIKLENHEEVVEDCTKALELRPDYLKAVMRRAQSNERLDKLEEAMKDYKKALELDPSQSLAQQAVMRLPQQIQEQHEKMKAEMIGKLKELGDAVLKPFGLSTSNFQLQQDSATGGYSVNFQK